MDEGVECAAEVCLAPWSILNDKEPNREEGSGMVVDVEEADLQESATRELSRADTGGKVERRFNAGEDGVGSWVQCTPVGCSSSGS